MTETVSYNAAKNRYEMDVNGAFVFGNVRRQAGTLYIDYVEAPVILQGTGAAGNFMKGLMETARAEKLKVVPICGYAAAWIGKHPEYNDLKL